MTFPAPSLLFLGAAVAVPRNVFPAVGLMLLLVESAVSATGRPA